MKKNHIPFAALIFLFGFSYGQNGPSDSDRKTASMHLKKTMAHMMSVLDGLDSLQLHFKPTPDSWSIANCAEHITLSETAFQELLRKTIAEGEDPSKKSEVSLTDEQLVEAITQRNRKVKTSERFEPSGKFGSHRETVRAFREKREEQIEYIMETTDDLRNRFNSDLPFGTVDGVQLLLFMSAHCERHVLQMEQILASEGFPIKPD